MRAAHYVDMNRVREILLTEYIGAILIALLISDAVVRVITLLGGRLYYVFVLARYLPESRHEPPFSYSILTAITEIALYLGSAYLLARWLYGSKRGVGPEGAQAPEDSAKRGR